MSMTRRGGGCFVMWVQDKLRVTQDERLANEIMEVLRRVRMRSASEGTGDPAEISE